MNIRHREDEKGEDNCRGRNRGKEARKKVQSEGKGEVEEVK